MVHSAEMSKSRMWSFEDDVLLDMSEDDLRRIPQGFEHSIAWILWHITRIEDVTMNLLVAGSPQVLNQDDWLKRTKSPICHTGNAMTDAEVAALSAALDIGALKAYRLAVGRRTREIVRALQLEDFKRKVDPERLRRISAEGAVVEAAHEIVDYWSKRTIAGLLLMPPTRHTFLHLNEALRVRQKLRRQSE